MKKIGYLIAAIVLPGILLSHSASAQATGSFDSSITFMGAARTLSMYVPTTYSPATPYRLIVGLHGVGDNSVNYRNALIGPLAWASNIPNTIFVCPEAATINTDFYSPAGDEAIIQASIDFAKLHYNIDTTDIVLQGFSLGGRAALRYGLDNYAKFRGLLLNTPAVQGVKEAINGESYYPFNYVNAPHIPIYITHDMNDILYESPIDSTFEQLVLNNGVVRYYQFPGLGHTIPPIASIINFIAYFDTPAVAGYDLDVVKATIAQRSCSATLPATCLVRNTGTDTIHSIILNYTVAGSTLSYIWSGILPSFSHAILSLPAITSPAGNQTLDVKVASLDAGITDTIVANNEKTVPFQVVTSGNTLPVFEGFEGVFPPVNWVQYLAGDIYSPWAADSTNKKTGIASMGAFNSALIFDNIGRKEDLASPLLDLTTVAHPQLSFDVAYNYHHYAPPAFTIDTAFADTLEVLISTDCGDSYTLLYKKGGADLATFPSPILNPTSIGADFISPGATHWTTETIDLSAYSGFDKAIVKFSYISALGGSINIDNVSFSGPLGTQEISTPAIDIYPNPAKDIVNINTGNERIGKVNVIDATGKTVMSLDNEKGNKSLSVNTSLLAEGVYVFQVITGSNVLVKKVNIVK